MTAPAVFTGWPYRVTSRVAFADRSPGRTSALPGSVPGPVLPGSGPLARQDPLPPGQIPHRVYSGMSEERI